MHILFATPGFLDNNGPTTGLPKYLFRTSKVLISWGHEVTIVTCSNRTVEYEFFGINIYRIRCPEIVHYGIQSKDEIALNLNYARIINNGIKHVVEKKKVDIIQYTNLYGVSFFHNFEIPAVLRLSSYASMWPVPDQEQRMEARADFERRAAIKCDAIFAPSYIVADRFSKDIGKKVKVIETPFIPETDEVDESVYRDLFKNKKYILFYGSLIEYKGIGIIADGIYDILSKYQDVYFGIIGNGDLRWIYDSITNGKEYSERIIYHPAIGFSQLIPIIKNAEFVTLPSLMENFSNACVETMALGQIVLGCNGASFEQLIVDGENGVLCTIGDSESFIKKVNEVLNYSEEQKKEMRQKASLSVERLRPELVTKQLLEYYEEVISQYWTKVKDKI